MTRIAINERKVKKNMTKEEFAQLLDGREYTSELTRDEEKQAADNGLLIIFGASDDLVEFRGAWREECGAWEGADVFITNTGLIEPPDCDCDYAQHYFDEKKRQGILLKAFWCHRKDGPSWEYEIEIPHKTFRVMEDGEVYCIGIIIDTNEMAKE